MTEQSKRRPNGRPPLDRVGSTVRSVRLSNAMYDALIGLARARGVEVSVMIRDAIARRILDERRERPR